MKEKLSTIRINENKFKTHQLAFADFHFNKFENKKAFLLGAIPPFHNCFEILSVSITL